MEKDELKSELFSELSKLGAAKGGRARASVLTPEERRESARKAVRARWERAGKLKPSPNQSEGVERPARAQRALPYSMFRGTAKIGDMEIECHVLNDLRRVLTQREVVRVLSGGRESGNLGRYLDRNPLFDKDLTSGPMIQFKVPGALQIANGYEATLLIEICETYLQARDQGLLKASQLKLAAQAETVMRACAKVGIIALIDEATGYQEVRAKHALQIKLQAFIADDIQEWARMFPDEFWFELARLEGIHYSPRSRPLRWGKYIMMFVYDAIDADIGRELRKKNPNPHFLQNHHQWLKKYGQDKVRSQIDKVVTIMKLCENMNEFRAKFARVFKKTPLQVTFDEINWTAAGN
jgi:hypothetical protein